MAVVPVCSPIRISRMVALGSVSVFYNTLDRPGLEMPCLRRND